MTVQFTTPLNEDQCIEVAANAMIDHMNGQFQRLCVGGQAGPRLRYQPWHLWHPIAQEDFIVAIKAYRTARGLAEAGGSNGVGAGTKR